MNCQEALNLLYDIIDKEATNIDAAEVQAHLDRCHDCLEKYNLEKTVHSLVSERLKSSKATKCTDVIRRDLLSKLDQIDIESSKSSGHRRGPRFGGLGTTLAIAALLLIVVGGSYVGASLYKHHKVFMPLEQAHWNDAERVAGAESDPSATNQAITFAQSVNFRIRDSLSGYSLATGHLENLMGVTMGHFLYKQGTQTVSVFVAPASFAIPEDLDKTAIMVNGIKMYDHNCRGCRLVYHRDGNAVIITATTDRTIDLLAFSPGRGTI